ncbi:hypothetical protein LN454_07600, partial [Xanthomonas campestris]|uniref:hypothetical protein n=1 Tax=Xanthomonas campestris TaxID=339 RepID=UPI001E47ADAE
MSDNRDRWKCKQRNRSISQEKTNRERFTTRQRWSLAAPCCMIGLGQLRSVAGLVKIVSVPVWYAWGLLFGLVAPSSSLHPANRP